MPPTEQWNPAVENQATDRPFRIGLIGDGTGAEKLLTDMGADKLLDFVKLNVSAVAE